MTPMPTPPPNAPQPAAPDPVEYADLATLTDEDLDAAEPPCGCHPVFHELGVHAPIGNARTVNQ